MIDWLRDQYHVDDDQALATLRQFDDFDQAFAFGVAHYGLPEGMTYEDIELRLDSDEFIARLSLAYSPPKSLLPVHLYTADEPLSADSWRGWHGVVGSDSQLHPIGGTHHTIMTPRSLNDWLRQCVRLYCRYSLYRSVDTYPRGC